MNLISRVKNLRSLLHNHVIDGHGQRSRMESARTFRSEAARSRGTKCSSGQPPTFRRPEMRSTVVKRSVVIAGQKTSVSLEDAFWTALREIAVARGSTLSALVTSI